MDEHLPSLQDLCLPVCLATITSSLSISNVWSVRRQLMFTWYTANTSIRFVLDAFICDHFTDISQTDEILSLDEQEMQWLLDNQDIKSCEATMLLCLLRWYQRQPADREKVFKDVFSKIHLSMIPREYLWSIINNNDLIRVMPELVEYKPSMLKELKILLKISDPSSYKQNLLNLAVFEHTKSDHHNHVVDAFVDTFRYHLECISPLSPLCKPFEFNVLQLCTNGIIESILGIEDIEVTAFDYDIIPFFFRENLYLFYFNKSNSHDVENPSGVCVQLKQKGVFRCAPCPNDVIRPSLTIACGMYVLLLRCRRPGTRYRSTVYGYDTVKDEWREMAPMIHDYDFFTSITVPYNNRYIFVFGKQHCDKYDIYTNKWSSIQPMPALMYPRLACQVGDKIFFFNALYKSSTTKDCFFYHPLSENWEELNNLHDPHRTMMCLSVRDLLSVSGRIFALSTGESTCYISEINLENREIQQLCMFVAPDADVMHMVQFSRGIRVFMEQNHTVQYTTRLESKWGAYGYSGSDSE